MDTTTTHEAHQGQGDDHEEDESTSQGEVVAMPFYSPSSSEYSGSSDEETALPEKKSSALGQAHSDEGGLSFSYEAGERILAYHQSLIYEAKVLKTSFVTDSEGRLQPMYYIHYQGWKDRWDEWVDDSRVMKYNEKTLQLQRQVSEERKRMLQSKKPSTPVSGSKKRDAAGFSGTKAKTKKTKTAVNAPPPKPTAEQIAAFQLDIPEAVKAKLVSDYQLVVRQKNLVPLPRQPTVGDLMDEFIDSFDSSPDYDDVADIMEGLRILFDKALGNMLLYRFERLQYLEISQRFPEKMMSDIYGAEHLLRFLMKLPELLAESSTAGPDRLAIKYQANRLVRWLAPKLEATAPYQPATPLYIRQAEA